MVGNRIKELREKAGISQVELARRARMASTNLNSIEHGRLAPWPKVKRRLAKALKTTEAELFPTRKEYDGK
jgi:transcriptional regulator with XRE-family HTH domain